MIRPFLTIAFLLTSLLAQPVDAAGSLPPVRLLCSFDYDDMLTRLKQQPLFASLNKEDIGSPIVLRVTHALVPTTEGKAAGLASAVLAGGTLGILPAVENKDLVITYDLFVNDSLLASYSYQKNFTRAFSIYSKDTTGGLGGERQTWALSTAAQFASDIAQNPKIAALISDYQFYFGTASAAQVR